MAQKKALTDEELLAQLDGFSSPAASTPSRSKKGPATAKDPLADLDELASLAKAKPLSRPNTPKLSSTLTSGRTRSPARRSAGVESGRNSEEGAKSRKSAESVASGTTGGIAGLTPTSEQDMEKAEQQDVQVSSGGWWGGLVSLGSAAVKQAEGYVKEIQKNEDAQKWADQVKGNVGYLKGFGDELRSKALPTFTNILHTIAPPISQHERLQIHITHDLVGYPSLDPTVHGVFSRVMLQVEGGDLLVIQRGSETRSSSSSRSGWSDGPWWRDSTTKRDMGLIDGLSEGSKLARANAEAFAQEFYLSRGGIDEAMAQASTNHSESNPVRSSDIFLAIQAIAFESDSALFQAASSSTSEDKTEMVEDAENDTQMCFAIYLHDPVHNIVFRTITQAIPRKWVNWLDAENMAGSDMQMPEDIAEIVLEGGIDPREWVSEWVEENIGLGVGVIAQRYVAKRMGVGEGGIGRGKKPAIESGAGELARAGV